MQTAMLVVISTYRRERVADNASEKSAAAAEKKGCEIRSSMLRDLIASQALSELLMRHAADWV
jgi:hypothetical protein